MASKVYIEHKVYFIDGTELVVSQSKIKYLRDILDTFGLIKSAENEDQLISVMVECVRIAMQQFCPEIIKTTEDVEDNFDIKTLYEVLDYCAGIKINKEDSVEEQAKSDQKGDSWDELDLAKLEAEVFLIGAWKNYEELETSLCMSELTKILESRRELDHQERKFLAAIQGVDIDEGKSNDAWEEMKNRVLYKGKDKNDITRLSGAAAQKAGFGIGNGLGYEEITA